MACKTNLWASADTHGRFERFTLENFLEQAKMTKNDLVIICGDFGGVWDRDKSVIMQRFKRSGTMEAVPLRTLTGCACDNGSSIRSALILQEQLTSQRGRAGGEIESLVSGGKSCGKNCGGPAQLLRSVFCHPISRSPRIWNTGPSKPTPLGCRSKNFKINSVISTLISCSTGHPAYQG